MAINIVKLCNLYASLVKRADVIDLTLNSNTNNVDPDNIDELLNQVNQFKSKNEDENNDTNNLLGGINQNEQKQDMLGDQRNDLLGNQRQEQEYSSEIPAQYMQQVASIKRFNKSLPDSFWLAFIKMCERLGTKPENIAKVINNESKFNPKAVNYQTVNGQKRPIAKGLNQIIKSIGLKIGMPTGMWENFENMSAEQQLPWVEKSFRASNIRGNMSATDIYARNFGGFPNPDGSMYASKAYIENHPQKDKFQRPDFQDIAYRQNIGLDKDKKGYITKKDLSRLVGE